MFGKKRKKTSQFSTYRQSGGLWQWVLAGSVLVVFAVIVGYAYMQKDTLEDEMLNPPLVASPDTPIKTRSENPGGIEIANQDKQVFDLLEKVNRKRINEKIIVIKPAKPSIIEDIAAPQKPKVVMQEPVVPVKKLTYAPTEKIMGDWGVQLASFSTFADAKNGLAKFGTQYNKLLGDLERDLQRASVQNKTYYRTRFMGLTSRREATAICRSLKQFNQGCLAVKK
jgi:hypothetical protein